MRRRGSGSELLAVETRKCGNGFAVVFDDDGAAIRKCGASDLAGERHVGKVEFRMLREMRGQIPEGLIGGGFGFRGNGENFVRLLLTGERDLRRFFEDHVRIGAADAERSNSGAAWCAGGRPIGEFVVYVERTALELDVRIDLLEVQAGGNLRVLERQHGLDEAGDAGRGVQDGRHWI